MRSCSFCRQSCFLVPRRKRERIFCNDLSRHTSPACMRNPGLKSTTGCRSSTGSGADPSPARSRLWTLHVAERRSGSGWHVAGEAIWGESPEDRRLIYPPFASTSRICGVKQIGGTQRMGHPRCGEDSFKGAFETSLPVFVGQNVKTIRPRRGGNELVLLERQPARSCGGKVLRNARIALVIGR
jgi:hypothetical protein